VSRKTFIILCLEGALLSFNVAASAALIPTISKVFGISFLLAGRVVWFYMLAYGVAALFYGPLVRVLDAKKIELFCFLLFSLANIFAGLSKQIAVLLCMRFLMGLFGASVIPLVLIILGEYIQEKKRGKLVGLFFSTTFFASLLGLGLSGVLAWRWIYLIPGFLGLLLWLVMYFFLPNFKPATGRWQINYFQALRNQKVWRIFTYIFLVSLFYHGIQQWLGAYFAQDFAFSQTLISILLTLTSLSGIFGEALGGWLADFLGRDKTVNLGIFIMLLSIALISFRIPLFFVMAVVFLWGLGWTFNHAGLSTLLTDLPKEFLNEAASLNSGVRFLSGGLGVAFAGVLARVSFHFSFFILGLGLGTLFLLNRQLLAVEGGKNV